MLRASSWFAKKYFISQEKQKHFLLRDAEKNGGTKKGGDGQFNTR